MSERSIHLIDRDELLRNIEADIDISVTGVRNMEAVKCCLQNILDDVKESPVVDALPVRHGKWIDCKSSEHMKCSVCGERAPIYWDEENMSYCEWLSEYCPNCGARMDEE